MNAGRQKGRVDKTVNLLIVDESQAFGGAVTGLVNLVKAMNKSEVRFFVVVKKRGILRKELKSAERCRYFNTHPIIGSGRYQAVYNFLSANNSPIKRLYSYFFTVLEFILVFPIFFISMTRLCSRYKIDIVNCNNGLKANFFTLLFLRITGKRCILFERTHVKLEGRGVFFSGVPEFFLADSNNRKKALIEAKVDPRKISVVPEPVAPAFLSDTEVEGLRKDPRWSPEYEIPDGRVRIGHVGRFVPWKGQEVFLRAAGKVFKERKNVQFFLVGTIEGIARERYGNKLKELSSSLGMDGHIEFVSFHDDIEKVMASFDIVVHSSIVPEPFGSVIAEAMFLGCPVVASADAGACEGLIDGNDLRMFSPGDTDELAAILIELVDDAAQRERLGKNARAKAKTVFSVKKIRDVMLDLVKNRGPG